MRRISSVVGGGLLVTAALALLISGCGKHEERVSVVARVGDASLTVEDLDQDLPEGVRRRLVPGQLREYVENWVQRELFAQEAERRGLDADAQLQRELERLKRELLAQKAVEALLPDSLRVAEEDARRYYEANKDQFVRDVDEVELAEIWVSQMALARDIYVRAKGGEDFGALAQKYSEGPGAKRGGVIGTVALESLPAPLRRRVAKAKPGALLKPIALEKGVVVVKVLNKYPAKSVRDFEEVRSRIMAELEREEYRKAYETALQELSQRKEVWVNEDLLKQLVSSTQSGAGGR
jgi:hypothetical protein